MPVAPFQYLNSHDHSHLICFAATTGDGPIPSGDRTRFYQLQPFAIALYNRARRPHALGRRRSSPTTTSFPAPARPASTFAAT
jgi:hypothetical protein